MPEQTLDRFFTAKEVANLLRVGKSSVFRYVKVIPGFPKPHRIVGAFIFERTEVLSWLEAQKLA